MGSLDHLRTMRDMERNHSLEEDRQDVLSVEDAQLVSDEESYDVYATFEDWLTEVK